MRQGSDDKKDRDVPQRKQEADNSLSETDKLNLFQSVAPEAASLFEQLQDPAITGEELYRQLSVFNERDRIDKYGNRRQAWRAERAKQGEQYFTIERSVSPDRTVAVDFTPDGQVDIRGVDHAYDRHLDRKFGEQVRRRSQPFWRRWLRR